METKISKEGMGIIRHHFGKAMLRAASDTTSKVTPFFDSVYGIEDILSRPFAEKIAKHHVHRKWLVKKKMTEDLPWDISRCLHESYFNNGMRDIENIVLEMLGYVRAKAYAPE